jgi:transposase
MTAKQKPTTKNDQIKKLYEEGLSITEIAERLGVRYQRVYSAVNVKVKAKPKQIQSEPKEG